MITDYGNHSHIKYDNDTVTYSALSVADVIIGIKGNKVAIIKDRNKEFMDLPELRVDKAIITARQSHRHDWTVSGSPEMFTDSNLPDILDASSELVARSFMGKYNMDNYMLKDLIKNSIMSGIIKELKKFEVNENEF